MQSSDRIICPPSTMNDKVELARPFVNEVLHFFRKQITELASQPDLVESLEVAVQCLEAIYRLPADDIDAQGGRVDVYELFENARSIVPEEKVAESEHLKNEGNRLMKEEKYQEALQMYTRAINIDPRNPIFYCNRAAAWIRLGDYDKSISDANQSLRYNPRYSKAFVRLGDTYYRMNKFREAANEYQKAIEIEPENEDYKNKLTMAMQRSLTALQANTNLPPNDPFVNMMSQVINDPGMQQLYEMIWIFFVN